jgi:hypothetical protein
LQGRDRRKSDSSTDRLLSGRDFFPVPWWHASLFALLIGTLQLSRALADRHLADEVLERGIDNALALLPRE